MFSSPPGTSGGSHDSLATRAGTDRSALRRARLGGSHDLGYGHNEVGGPESTVRVGV